ncbi:hypothetical protein LJY18_07180 [Pseudomonas sp. MMS21-TM103]|uniref:hypothetical protein n=1 Tax=Pseudomonas sp. MMS21 TM103 TaxID=2886506 RepID=UPI001EE028F1|nr:hypothetical protein [Pseudomonas sp. MMS21 TM103]MCG4453092.1 hypothetical protein [Pseudomonas sp. MMS21 TM103]
MFEVMTGNLEQGAECFAAQLARRGRQAAVAGACSRLINHWSLLGLLALGWIAFMLVE